MDNPFEEQSVLEEVVAMDCVSIKDIKMPFWSMVGFMVKLSVASIPAMVILSILGMFLCMGVAGILGAAGVI